MLLMSSKLLELPIIRLLPLSPGVNGLEVSPIWHQWDSSRNALQTDEGNLAIAVLY